MPVFIFIAGYFSKRYIDYGIYVKKAITNALLPYVIFNIAYGFLFAGHGHKLEGAISLFQPKWTLWFLLSIFFWKIMVEPFSKFRWPLILSLLLSLYVGMVSQVGTFLALSKTFSFFPYFLAGYLLTPDNLDKIRKQHAWLPSIFFIAVMIVVGVAVGMHVNSNTLLMKVPYAKMGQSYLAGMSLRGICLLLGFICIWFFISVIPAKKSMLSDIGMFSLTAYLAHSGIIRLFEFFKFKISNPVVFILFAIILSVAVCFLFGNRHVYFCYKAAMDRISRVLVG